MVGKGIVMEKCVEQHEIFVNFLRTVVGNGESGNKMATKFWKKRGVVKTLIVRRGVATMTGIATQWSNLY